MDITQRAAKLFPLKTTGEPYQTHTLEKIKVVRELVIEIERLRVERIELFKESFNSAEEIEKLREALKFYANRKHYDLFVRAHSSMGEYETSFIQDDGGHIAREVLGEE